MFKRDRKRSIERLKEDAALRGLSQRDKDLLLVYEDKTYILFGTTKKNKKRTVGEP